MPDGIWISAKCRALTACDSPGSIRPWVAVTVEASNFMYGFALDRVMMALRIADRHQRVGLHIGGELENLAHLLLKERMYRGEDGTVPERAAGADHVLHRRVDT